MTPRIGIPVTILAAALLLTGCNSAPSGPTQHETRTMERDKAERLHVDLNMGAGELEVSGGSAHQADLDFTYTGDAAKPRVDYHSGGAIADLSIAQPDHSGNGDSKYRWDIRLSDQVLTDISAKLGAGEIKMNLGSVPLRDLQLKVGAGSAKIDLRGHPQRSYDVRVEGGAGEAILYLPKSVGITATASGGLGEINVDGLEERNGRWVNPGHENSPVTIRVDVKGGIGSIRIEAE